MQFQSLDLTEQEQGLIAEVGAIFGISTAEAAQKMLGFGLDRRTNKAPQKSQVVTLRRKTDREIGGLSR